MAPRTPAPVPVSRRDVLRQSLFGALGVAAGGLALTACTGDPTVPTTTATPATPTPAQPGTTPPDPPTSLPVEDVKAPEADLFASHETEGTTLSDDLTPAELDTVFLPFDGASKRRQTGSTPIGLVTDTTAPDGAGRVTRWVTRHDRPVASQNHVQYWIGGANTDDHYGGQLNQIYLICDLLFESGFDFNMGGKIPFGFAGNAPGTGIPWGGSNPKDGNGHSVRLMWRGPNYGPASIRYPRLEAYAYRADSPHTYGDEWQFEIMNDSQASTGGNAIEITTDTWYRVGFGVNLWAANGLGWLKLYLDGRKVRTIPDIKWKNDAMQHFVNCAAFSMFSGGNTEAWRPSVTSYLRVCNYRYGTTPESVGLAP